MANPHLVSNPNFHYSPFTYVASDVSLLISPAALSATPGTTSDSALIQTVTAGGFHQFVTPSAIGLPPGITAKFDSKGMLGNITSGLAFIVGANVAPGTYPLTVMIAGGGLTKSYPFTFTVTAAPIAVTVNPGNANLAVSQTQQFSATVANTTNGAVTWSVIQAAGYGSIIGRTARHR